MAPDVAAALKAVLTATTSEERKAAVAEYARLQWETETAEWSEEQKAEYNRREHAEAERRNARNRRRMLAHRRLLSRSRPNRWTRVLLPTSGAASACRQRRISARAPRARRVGGRTRTRAPAREPEPEPDDVAGVPA